jgi:hypothetical protein
VCAITGLGDRLVASAASDRARLATLSSERPIASWPGCHAVIAIEERAALLT